MGRAWLHWVTSLRRSGGHSCVKQVPLLGCVVCSGVCRPRCGAVLLLLGASVPGGGGTADGRMPVCA